MHVDIGGQTSVMITSEKSFWVSFALMQWLLLNGTDEEPRNGQMDIGTKKSNLMCFLTTNIPSITQLITLQPSPFERSNRYYIFIS